MDLEQWWTDVMPETRTWLAENSEAALTPEVVADISRAGGLIAAESWWMGERGPDGVFLSPDAAQWVRERDHTAR